MADTKGKRLSYYNGEYIVFDLETTGLSPAADEIVEISGIKVLENTAVKEFSTLVNPGIPISPAAARVNGITDEMVRHAPPLAEALGNFLDFAGDRVLVGHNIHTFDMVFLRAGAARKLGRDIPNDYVDTLYLARNCLPFLTRHRLVDVAEHFGIATDGAHRALADCHMNLQCYIELGNLWEKREKDRQNLRNVSPGGEPAAPAACCPRCGSPLVKRNGKFGVFWGCSGFPMCRYTRNG